MDGNLTDNNRNSLHVDYKTLFEYKTAELLLKIFAPCFLVLGTVGNILSVIVMSWKTMRQSTTTLYLIILSFSDLVVLYTGLLRYWIRTISDTDISHISNVNCKLNTLFSDCSSWLLVAVTLERVAVVCWPHRGKTACTKKVACVVVTVIFVSLLLLNSHFLYGRGDKITLKCNFTEVVKCTDLFSEYQSFVNYTWPWIDLWFFCLMPFFILIFGNTCIIVKVVSSKKAVRLRVEPVGSNGKRLSRISLLTVMLLLASFVSILCNAPVCVYLIGIHYWVKETTPKENAILELVYAFVAILMYLNNAVNFLLYCVSSPRFRRELKSLLSSIAITHITAIQFTNTVQTNHSCENNID